MSAGTDLFTIILAAGVIAVFGVFFWLVGSHWSPLSLEYLD